MHTASVAVPVPGMPASANACTFASVTVMTAFTSAAGASATGIRATTLIVPGRHGAAAPSASAAHVASDTPTVAHTSMPSSLISTASRTATAVSMPTPSPSHPCARASSSMCASISVRA